MYTDRTTNQQDLSQSQTSEFPNPIGPHLSQLFKTSLPELNSESLSSRTFYTTRNKGKANDTFIPFISERDKMNRLMPLTSRDDSKRIIKGLESTQSREPRFHRGYKVVVDYSPVHISKESHRNLKNLVGFDSISIDKTNSLTSPSELGAFLSSGGQAQSCKAFSQFKVSLPAPQKNITTPSRRTNSNFAGEISLSGHRDTGKEEKPNAAFLATSRDKMAKIRTKSHMDGPSVGYYDPNSSHFVKPRLKNVKFSETRYERHKPLEKTDDGSFMLSYSKDQFKKTTVDFSKQISREVNNLFSGNSKKVILKNGGENPKDIRELERDFQFSKQLREKYNQNIKLPHGLKITAGAVPYGITKITDVRRNILRFYNLVQDKIDI